VAEHDPHPTAPGNVPGLIDQYRQRHRAWLAQADELVRLRDEVRLAAEREAVEIVTAARRDVRRIIVEARRELLVLTAQLHAAVDAVDQSAIQPPPGLGPALPAPPPNDAALSNTQDLVRGARREVRAVLDEARAEIEALAAESHPSFPPAAEPGPSPWEAGVAPTFSGPFPAPAASARATDETAPETRADAPAEPVASAGPGAEPVAEPRDASPNAVDTHASDASVPEPHALPAETAQVSASQTAEPHASSVVATDAQAPIQASAPVMSAVPEALLAHAASAGDPEPMAMAALDESLQEPWVPESWLHELTGSEPAVSKAPTFDLHVPEVVLAETASLESLASDWLATDVTEPADVVAKPAAQTTATPADLDAAAAALAAPAFTASAPRTPAPVASPSLDTTPLTEASDVASLWADATDRLDSVAKPALAPVRFEWKQPSAKPAAEAPVSLNLPAVSAGAQADLPATSGIFETHAEHSQKLSRVFASTAGSDGNAARVPARTFVGLFAGAGLIVLMGTLWWMNARTSAMPETRVADEAPAAAPAAPERSAPEANTPPTAPDAQRSLSLTIEVRRPSWIRASIDGQEEAGRLYQAGETRQIVGAKTVAVRAGDAGAVLVSVNGAPAQSLGADGAATTRRFDVAELSGSAPATTALASAPDAVPAAGAARLAPKPVPAVEATAAQPGARADARPAAPGAAPATAPRAAEATLSGGRPDLLGAGQQWLDAYQRRDREAMSVAAAENINITDERSVAERFPAAVNSVRRDLDQVELELTGDTALLTARMTERGDASAAAAPYISRISQIWVRRSGQWRLADVRIIGEARLSQIVR
jgi:hypothetical protein